ncbi:MAG: sugar phosphate isomerase/epimerase family protein [Thermoguttaceae bacterium]
MQRREFLTNTAGWVAAASLLNCSGTKVFSDDSRRLPVALNQYTVSAFYSREGIDFLKNLDRCLAEMKQCGADGLEPMIGSLRDSAFYGKALRKQDMDMRSIYMGVNLHDEDAAQGERDRVLESAQKAAEYGTRIVVINPAPKSGKSDSELARQSQNMNTLGAELRKLGLALCFHYHTTELENGGREFHHLMCGTEPENLGLCFDVHWSFRASGNSAIAAYDHARLYGDRVVEFHLRQSKDGIWTELFEEGDIDYDRVAQQVAGMMKTKPYIVLEQAPESGTPNTMKSGEVFSKSLEMTRKIFEPFV